MKTKFINIASGSFFLSIFLLLIPCHVQGWVFDFTKTKISALSEQAGFVASVFVFSIIFFIIGYFLLLISTFLLNGMIAITPTALTVRTGEAATFITDGWSFTAGLVNMILIIAFIIIAFAVILGSEKIQIKKALPRLILVALLVNFTLLFVGIGIDISNFLFNTIANQFMAGAGREGNILQQSVAGLFDFSSAQITAVAAQLGLTALALKAPFFNAFVLAGWIGGLPWLLTSVFQFLVYGGIMWMLSGVFFFYFLVFLVRIFIIQVLAVLAPLAFFCLIFDETKKYWDQWRNALIEWLFVGVVFIFLMYFGLAMAPLIISMAEPFDRLTTINAPIFGWWLDQFGPIVGYIALLAYFIVIAGIAKKFIPAAAQAMISQASSIVKLATPWAGAIAQGAGRKMRGEELERQEKIKERESLGEKPWWSKSGAQTRAMKLQSWMVRGAHNMTGTGVQQGAERDVEANVKNFKENYDPNDLVQRYQMPGAAQRIMHTPTSEDIAALQFLSDEDGADALDKLPPEVLANLIKITVDRGFKKIARNAVKHIPDYGDVLNREEELEKANQSGDVEKIKRARENHSAAEKIQSAMMSDIKKVNPDISNKMQELKQEEEKLATAIDEGEQTTIKEKIKEIKKGINELSRDAIHKISIRSLKAKDIENLSDSTVRNAGFQAAVIKNKDMSFIAKLLEDRKNGPEIILELSNIIENSDIIGGVKGLEKENPILYNQIRQSNVGQSIFGNIHELIKKEEKGQGGNKRKKK